MKRRHAKPPGKKGMGSLRCFEPTLCNVRRAKGQCRRLRQLNEMPRKIPAKTAPSSLFRLVIGMKRVC